MGVDQNSIHCSSESPSSTTTPPRNAFSDGIFNDVAGDVTIVVDGQSFLLHKFPLASRCGRIRRMVAKSHTAKDPLDTCSSKLQLDIPGGAQTFELAAKFCYGINFEINSSTVAHLLCAAHYLEMTDHYQNDNLISRAEAYLKEVVLHSIDKSLEVLSACESLPLLAEELDIPEICIVAISTNACKEQLVSSFSKLDRDCDRHQSHHGSSDPENHCQGTCGDGDNGPVAWWVEDLSMLRIDYFRRVVTAMTKSGVRTGDIIASLMHYAQVWLKGMGRLQIWNPARMRSGCGNEDLDQKTIIDTLVQLLPKEYKTSTSIPLHFLFGMLRMAIVANVTASCKLDLERRLGSLLDMASLDDLLIPSVQPGDSLFDVDIVCRILINFLQRVEEEEAEDCWYQSGAVTSSPPRHGQAMLKVGLLVEAYLAEIARDPYLSLPKFISVIEILPDYSRVIDDGLYTAIDTYLKVHPNLSEDECKRVCRFIDCQKLSQEASNHAAQNDRLPVQVTVRVLYFEQLRLKNSVSGSSGGGDGFFSQKISSGVPSAAMSPRDNYASLRRENRELKLEISRLRMRLSELEKEQAVMKQEIIDKSVNTKTFFTSISKGIGRIGIFSGPVGKKFDVTRVREERHLGCEPQPAKRESLELVSPQDMYCTINLCTGSMHWTLQKDAF